jgi:hypothetical protein
MAVDLSKELSRLSSYSTFLRRVEPASVTQEQLISALNLIGLPVPSNIVTRATSLVNRAKQKNLAAALADPTLIAELQSLFDGDTLPPSPTQSDIELALACPHCSGLFIRRFALPGKENNPK